MSEETIEIIGMEEIDQTPEGIGHQIEETVAITTIKDAIKLLIEAKIETKVENKIDVTFNLSTL